MKLQIMQSNGRLRCLDNGKVSVTFVSKCSVIYGMAPCSVFVRANRVSEVTSSVWSELVHLGHH